VAGRKELEEVIRSFLAIELPEEIKERLGEIQSILKPLSSGISWVKPGNIHLTLKFLGNVQIGMIPKINEKIEEVTRQTLPFSLWMEGSGAFPHIKRPNVIWMGIKGDLAQLNLLQRGVEERLEDLGFPREHKDFRPHLTIGRVRNLKKLGDLKIGIEKFMGERSNPFQVKEVVLFKSQLNPGGAVYTKLETFPFGGENGN